MYIKSIRLTKDKSSIKVAYEKNGSTYVRKGSDGFRRGTRVKGDVSSTLSTWGFRKVDNVPYFYDGEEISQNIHRFEMKVSGEISYNG